MGCGASASYKCSTDSSLAEDSTTNDLVEKPGADVPNDQLGDLVEKLAAGAKVGHAVHGNPVSEEPAKVCDGASPEGLSAKTEVAAGENEESAPEEECATKAMFGCEGDYDHRGNVRARSLAESVWAVRVLRAMPQEVAESFWHHIMSINEVDDTTFPSLCVEFDDAQNTMRTLGGVGMAGFVNIPEFNYKFALTDDGTQIGMDAYVWSRTAKRRRINGDQSIIPKEPEILAQVMCARPDGHGEVTMCNRDRAARDEFFYQFRGRHEWQEGKEGAWSWMAEREKAWNTRMDTGFAVSRCAGITTAADATDELAKFFPMAVHHGGKTNLRGEDGWLFRAFRVPFIAGASGSLMATAMTMEDTMGGKYPDGLIPLPARELLLAAHTAALVAGGQHSLGECIIALQAVGYFQNIPQLMRGGSYLETMVAFEAYLHSRGMSPAIMTSTESASTYDFPMKKLQSTSQPTQMETFAVDALSPQFQSLHEDISAIWERISSAEPVLVPDAAPSDAELNLLRQHSLAEQGLLWGAAFSKVELATASTTTSAGSDDLGLLAITKELPAAWIDEEHGGRKTEVVHISILLNMRGVADILRMEIATSACPKLECKVASLQLTRVARITDAEVYAVVVAFYAPQLHKLKEAFFVGMTNTEVQRYDRYFFESHGGTDGHATLAYIRAEYQEQARAFVESHSDAMMAAASVFNADSIIVQTGTPNALAPPSPGGKAISLKLGGAVATSSVAVRSLFDCS